ncbi:MAG TPA: TonB-dependent receptor [Pseudomonadales bacterium]
MPLSRPAYLFLLSSFAGLPAWGAPVTGLDEIVIPEIITATRLRQSQADTPASMTVIDRNFIASSGIRNLPEIFRFVPGMSVASRDGYNYVVSYHGTNFVDSRRMQVLLDGRSVYSTGLANVSWTDLPVSLEDIERIEITRGPDASTYGANAFLGAINIITRHPQDSEHLALSTRQGDGGIEDYQLRYSDGHESAQWRATLSQRHDNGFDTQADGVTDRRDSNDQWLADGRLTLTPDNSWLIDLQAGYKNGTHTEDAFDGSIRTYPNPENTLQYVSAIVEKTLNPQHTLKMHTYYRKETIEQDWVSCLPPITLSANLGALYLSNPGYVAELLDGNNPMGTGGTARDDALALASLTDYFSMGGPAAADVCGYANQDTTQTRQHIEFQDTWVASEQFRMVAGASFRQDEQTSETYLNGSVDEDSVQVFAHGEYRLGSRWVFNLGGLYEDEETADNTFSPRAAINFNITPGQTLRAVYSEAYRTPDIFENSADWSYVVRSLDTPVLGKYAARYFPTAQAKGHLDNEHIVSHEIGYFGNFPDSGVQIDIKLFHDKLDHLISQGMSITNFNPNNYAHLTQDGAETEIHYWPTRDIHLRLTYAYIDVDTEIWFWRETLFTPENAASLFAQFRLPQQWDWSVSYYYADNINFKHFSRADTRLAKVWPLRKGALEIAGIIQHRLDNNGDLFSDNLYENDTRAFIQAELRF